MDQYIHLLTNPNSDMTTTVSRRENPMIDNNAEQQELANNLSLLCSNQELLNNLSFHMSAQRQQQQQQQHVGFYVDRNNNPNHHHQSNIQISERQPAGMDLLQPKRFSMDLLGGSNHILAGIDNLNKGMLGASDKFDMVVSRKCSTAENNASSCDMSSRSCTDGFKKKRRLSNLGLLSPTFFEDHANRRSSMTSVATFASVPSVSHHEGHDDEADDTSIISEFDHNTTGGHANNTAAMPPPPPAQQQQQQQQYLSNFIPHQDPRPELRQHNSVEVRDIMKAFADSMARSTKSQQAIHDWDKKMGLKRSHSKTMRLSMRSRKKLKTMVRKQINALLA